jgi:hypothetical protein
MFSNPRLFFFGGDSALHLRPRPQFNSDTLRKISLAQSETRLFGQAKADWCWALLRGILKNKGGRWQKTILESWGPGKRLVQHDKCLPQWHCLGAASASISFGCFLGSVVHTGRETEGLVDAIDFVSRCLVLSLGVTRLAYLPPANRPDQA